MLIKLLHEESKLTSLQTRLVSGNRTQISKGGKNQLRDKETAEFESKISRSTSPGKNGYEESDSAVKDLPDAAARRENTRNPVNVGEHITASYEAHACKQRQCNAIRLN